MQLSTGQTAIQRGEAESSTQSLHRAESITNSTSPSEIAATGHSGRQKSQAMQVSVIV